MENRTVTVPAVNKSFVLVPREQLRRKTHGRWLAVPTHLKAIVSRVPTPPAAFDWSKGGTLDFPVLGNDRYGDCYYAAVAHGSQCYTGNAGDECTFDVQALINRYLRISGGDNGLSDEDIMPEWKAGIVGPNGPRKILDEMTIDPGDDAAIALGAWAFGGLIYTCALLDTWLRNPRPGDTWDKGGRPDQGAGHAMYLTGKNTRGNLDCQTWGFKPPINLTLAGMRASDPELIVAFSLDHFDDYQRCAFTGLSYEEKAELWTALGGQTLPPAPWGPSPPPPPPPPPPSGHADFTLNRDLKAGSYVLMTDDVRHALENAIDTLTRVLPCDTIAVIPPELRERLKAGTLTFAKIFAITLAIIGALNSGPLTPEKLAALAAQIQAILAQP